MNPNWIVVRPRPIVVAPLKRGAVEVTSYGLHARERPGGLWKLTTAHPDNHITSQLCCCEMMTSSLLDHLAELAVKAGDKRRVVVWYHGLADAITTLFRAFKQAFSCSTEPVVTWDGSQALVTWQGYYRLDGARVELRQAEREIEVPSLRGWDVPPFRLALLRGPVGAATLTFKGKASIRLLDSQAYVKADLFDRATRGLVAYAVRAAERGVDRMHPAEMTRVIGERIADVWSVCDVAPRPTPAATGAALFRRSYLAAPLQTVPYHVESAAELAFHGGKIGLWTIKGARIPRVRVYDLRSAYAWAMTMIPSFYSGEWVRVRVQKASNIALLPGFSRVCGHVKCCRWPVIPSHNGQWTSGRITRTWITNYELTEAVNSGELQLDECVSWCWVEREGESSPWKAFSEEVFRRRDLATDALRDIYKGSLVGLYGKTVQRSIIPPVPPDGALFEHGVPVAYCNKGGLDDQQPSYFRAGGCYYPVVGSLVTGLVRARMHAAEHRYEAVHSAVDAIHTLVPIPDEEIGPGLGQWRYVGEGEAYYEAANRYRINGPNGWRKRAQAGRPSGTIDDEQEIAG